MTETQSEDAPLLGSGELLTPGECSPTPEPNPTVPPGAWAPPGLKDPWPPDMWPESNKLQVPGEDAGERGGGVISQTSMDSGCDCDPTEGGSNAPSEPPQPPKYEPMSPLSPSQPGGGGGSCLPSPPGGYSVVTHCYHSPGDSHQLPHHCVCDISDSESSTLGQGAQTPSSHVHWPSPDQQNSKVTFRIEGDDEDEDVHPSIR